MKKLILCLLIIGSPAFPAGLVEWLTVGAGPSGSVYKVENRSYGSLVIGNLSGSSITVNSINPYLYAAGPSLLGASLFQVPWAPPSFMLYTASTPWAAGAGNSLKYGPSSNIIPPNTGNNGGSVFLNFPFVAHKQSIRPQYSGNSLVALGLQSFIMGASVVGNDGNTTGTAVSIEVDPLSLPGSEVSGVTNW